MEFRSKPLMVAVDIDGTLLNDSSQISLYTIEKIREANASGIKVVLSTGRSFESASIIEDSINAGSEIIAFNGAMIISKSAGVLYHKTMKWNNALNLIKHLREMGAYTLMFINNKTYSEKIDPRNQYYEHISKENVSIVEGFEALQVFGEPTKLLISTEEHRLDILKKELLEKPLLEGVNIVKSLKFALEVIHRDVSKANAVKFLANYYNIPLARVAAIGDNENDMDMLTSCPLSIAMGNAPEMVKKCCKYITLDNNQDGVAHAFSKYIL